MKITLFSLNASRSHTNLAIRILRQRLREEGFDKVSLLERTEKERSFDTLAALACENADLYGFSCYIWNIAAHLTLAENLKKLRPNVKIVFGGPEVSFEDEDFLKAHPFIDTLLKGEGEETIVTLAKTLSAGEPLPRILCGRPYPDFMHSSVPYTEDENRVGNILYYESARGCPYRCAYCLSAAEEHKTVRAKSVDDTLADLKRFEAFLDVKVIKFVDRTFNYDKNRAKAIWTALLDPAYTKHYHFEICASLLDEESFKILQRFPKGKLQLEIGVQSTDPTVLEKIDRPNDTEAVLNALERLYRFDNMHIHADLIAGLPGDSYRSIRKSFDALYGKCHMLQLGFLKLLKGSPLYKRREAYGYCFHSEPPYEVLSSDTLSFDEIMRLKRIEAVLERYVNSGRFRRSMLVLTDERSPFCLLEALADFLPDVTTLSQRDAYVKLLEFDESLDGDSRATALTDAITLDFLLNEQGRVPSAIRHCQVTLTSEEKRKLALRHPDLYIPSTEVYRLHTLGTFAVDRAHKIYYRL